MPKLRRVSGHEAIRALEPLHQELAIGTLQGILKQAGVMSDEFMKILQS